MLELDESELVLPGVILLEDEPEELGLTLDPPPTGAVVEVEELGLTLVPVVIALHIPVEDVRDAAVGIER